MYFCPLYFICRTQIFDYMLIKFICLALASSHVEPLYCKNTQSDACRNKDNHSDKMMLMKAKVV